MPSFTHKLPSHSVLPTPSLAFSFLLLQIAPVGWPFTKHCFQDWHTGGWQCAHSVAPWKPHTKTCFLQSNPTNLLLGSRDEFWMTWELLSGMLSFSPHDQVWRELLPAVVWTPCVGGPSLAWCYLESGRKLKTVRAQSVLHSSHKGNGSTSVLSEEVNCLSNSFL